MIKNFLILLLSVTFFVACSSDSSDPEVSGGSSSNTAHKTGTFYITAPVANLHYKTDTFDDYTDDDGQFKYREGETISFSVAGVPLGSAEARSVITPFNLVPGSADAENSSAVNMIALLLSVTSGGFGSVFTVDNAVSAYTFASNFDLSNPADTLALLSELTTNTDNNYTMVDSSTLNTILNLLGNGSSS